MTKEIPRNEWKGFCDDLSRDRVDWQTSVQVLSIDTGAQMLSDGLPLIGLTYEIESGHEKIQLVTGTGAGIHQTHSIYDPLRLALEENADEPGGTLDIEDDTGTKTLVTFIRPASMPMAYEKGELVAVR